MPVDQVVDVVAVRDRLVAATGPVHVAELMGPTGVTGRATRAVVAPLTERVFIDVVAVHMV